jgi:mannose/fructose/sorbose-specific phosphotransferase system IIA component
MAVPVIFVSHGGYAEGVRDAAQLILGEQPHVGTVSLPPNGSTEQVGAEVSAALDRIGVVGGEALILADLMGGSPANAVGALALASPALHVVSGLNLPMVLEVLTSTASTAAELAAVAAKAGRDGIIDVGARLRAAVGPGQTVGVANADLPTDAATWLLLIYRIPSEPTRLRAAVWRRLKGLGAIYLQNSAAALPASTTAERALRKLRREIVEMSGTAVLLSCSALVGEQDVRAAFQAARDDEYEEIVDKCQDFMAQLDKEYHADHFTYAELEENEEDLTKLRNWFAKITDRDVFGAPGRAATVRALETCERALEEYAARVYAEEAESH